MHYNFLVDRICYLKEDAKGVEAMCRAMEDMRKETDLESPHVFAENNRSLWEELLVLMRFE